MVLLNGKWGNYVLGEIYSIVYWNVLNYHTPEKIELIYFEFFGGVTRITEKTKNNIKVFS